MHAETTITEHKATALAAFKDLARDPGVPKPDPILVVDDSTFAHNLTRFGGAGGTAFAGDGGGSSTGTSR